MAELWEPFCAKLKESGYTLKDLDYCSDDLFLTIAEELGTFSPLQISSLLSYSHRVKRAAGTATGGSAADRSSTTTTRRDQTQRETAVKPAPAYPATSIKQAAQRLLDRVGGGSGGAFTAQDVIGVEAPLSSWHAFQACVAAQPPHPHGRDPVTLLWKLCSPDTLAHIERACAASRTLALSADTDADALCESGIVLYDGSVATALGSNAMTPAALRRRLDEEGWALVAFDVAAGTSRSVSVEEVGNLRNFSMAQCHEMLREAGYDSLTVSATGAVVVCDATQLVPRNVVFVAAEPPSASSMASAAVDRDVSSLRPAAAPAIRGRPRGSQQLAASTASTARPDSHNDPPRRLDYSAVAEDDAAAAQDSRNGTTTRNVAVRTLPSSQHEQQQQQQLTVVAPQPPTTRCDVHPQKEVEFWCATEKRLLCSHCLYYDGYSRENCLPIEVAARQEVPRLARWVGNATTFGKEVQGVLQLFADATADITRREDKACQDITQQFAQLRERLGSLEADMLHEVRDQSRSRRQDVEAAGNDVADTVERVSALVREVDAPMKLYGSSGSAAGLAVCVQLLRAVQRAFGDWPAVDIAAYSVVQPFEANFLAGVESALATVPKVAVTAGRCELPEAIDVNYLHADCE